MEDNRKPPVDLAREMVNQTGKDNALLISNDAINEKRKEIPISMNSIVWIEEIEYLKKVKEEIIKL